MFPYLLLLQSIFSFTCIVSCVCCLMYIPSRLSNANFDCLKPAFLQIPQGYSQKAAYAGPQRTRNHLCRQHSSPKLVRVLAPVRSRPPYAVPDFQRQFVLCTLRRQLVAPHPPPPTPHPPPPTSALLTCSRAGCTASASSTPSPSSASTSSSGGLTPSPASIPLRRT